MARFEAAASLLASAIRRARIDRQVEAAGVLKTTSEWLEEQWGEIGKTQALPLKLEGGVLVIRTLNAGMASEIRLCAQRLLTRIKERHSHTEVREIRVGL